MGWVEVVHVVVVVCGGGYCLCSGHCDGKVGKMKSNYYFLSLENFMETIVHINVYDDAVGLAIILFQIHFRWAINTHSEG